MSNCADQLQCNDKNQIFPQIPMGFMGEIFFDAPINKYIYANNISLQKNQQINTPKPIDARYGYSTYSQQSSEIGGSIQFSPLTMDILRSIWNAAQARDQVGSLKNKFDIFVSYSKNQKQYVYKSSLINQISLKVKPLQPVVISLDIMSKTRNQQRLNKRSNNLNLSRNFLQNHIDSTALFFVDNRPMGQDQDTQLTSVDIKLSNNLQRIYTGSGGMDVYYIATGLRQLSGSLQAIGSVYDIAKTAQQQYKRCNSNSYLSLKMNGCNDYNSNSKSNIDFKFQGLVFQIQQIQLQAGSIMKSTINFKSIAGGTGMFGNSATSYIV